MSPKVSVIIPLYNGERYIRAAVESVLCQTFQDFELIVVDDGSTDQGKDIILSMEGPIAYLYQENSGVCSARNQGFLNSRGDYIAFLDQDDRWYPPKLEIQAQHLDQNLEIGIVYSDMDLIDDFGEVIGYRYLGDRNRRSEKRLRKFLAIFPEFPHPHPYPSVVMMRREIFLQSGMFDPTFTKNCHEDTELWFRIVKKKLAQFFFYPEPLAQRRCHSLQGGGDEEARHGNWVICLNKLLKLYEDEPKKERYLRSRLARIFFKSGSLLLKEGDLRQGRIHLKRALNCCPFYWKNLKRLVGSYLRVARGRAKNL